MRFSGISVLLLATAVAQTGPPAPKPAKPPASTAGTTSATKGSGAAKAPVAAVDPDEGSIDGGIYTSDFFHFSYMLPEGFSVDEEFLANEQDESNSTFVLLAAEGPLSGEDRRDVVVILADREATTADAYIQKVTRDYAQKQGFEVLKPAYTVTLGGKPFYRADFRKEGTYQTAVFTVLKGYAVGFSIAAPNVEAMNALIESLNTVKFGAEVPHKAGVAPPKAPTAPKPPGPRAPKTR